MPFLQKMHRYILGLRNAHLLHKMSHSDGAISLQSLQSLAAKSNHTAFTEPPLSQELILRKKKEGEMYLAHFKIINNISNAVLQILNSYLHSFFFFLQWILSYIAMKQPWVYMCSPCRSPSHLPLHPLPLGLPSAPGPSTCLMHPTWAGDLFHPR